MSDGGRPGDEAVEALREAREYIADFSPQDDAGFYDDVVQERLDQMDAVLDRVRSRPAGGTQDEDHEAGIEAGRRMAALTNIALTYEDGLKTEFVGRGEAWVPKTDPGTITGYDPPNVLRVISNGVSVPVSGTEPDTATLGIEDVVEFIRREEAERGDWYAGTVDAICCRLLAGFSVDAGKRQSEAGGTT